MDWLNDITYQKDDCVLEWVEAPILPLPQCVYERLTANATEPSGCVQAYLEDVINEQQEVLAARHGLDIGPELDGDKVVVALTGFGVWLKSLLPTVTWGPGQ